MRQDWKRIFESEGFLYHPISGGDGSSTLTADEQAAADQKAADDKVAADKKVADDKALADKEAAEKSAKASEDPNLAAINSQIAEQTRLLQSLVDKQEDKSKAPVWTIEKLEEAELKCHSGEYDMKYLPKITTMKALLTARQVAKETTDGFAKENTWADVQAKWDKGLVNAVEVFGDDAKDVESKLFKTAQAILLQDPGYVRFQDLKSKGVKLSAIDPTLIDPNLQFKCFEIAAGRLGVARKDVAPNTTGRGGKTSLGGGSREDNSEGQSALDKLEAKAVSSGRQEDWIALDKARLQQQREARR